ncbi:MAG: class II fumarate hydratase [Pseudomonadales bacterium]|nr:class II fumarate hydratase [Pseudomonadales bacterium]
MTRTEQDSLGAIQVPKNALYGAQTQRAINNFPISGESMPERFIRALLLVKAAAAKANLQLNQLPVEIGDSILQAIDQLHQDPDLMNHFPVDVFQTGSGTSTNMNANEVIATLASVYGSCSVHPNDHVNCSQSSNDVIPTTIHVSAALAIKQTLLPAMQHLIACIHTKAESLNTVVKTGRTHLMDAMPVRFSQVMNGWASQINHNAEFIQQLLPKLQQVAQGGTAVGTGINAPENFAECFCNALSREISLHAQLEFVPAGNKFALLSSQDVAVSVSAQLRTLAISISKIANDLRWMNSGPLAGLAEIQLPALQPGSSIMPGKVNPVIPEAVLMVGAQVIGLDASIACAGQSGNFELNVMLPLIARNLLSSIELLSNACLVLADKAIIDFTVNHEKIAQALSRNPILVTALNSRIGYEKAAEIAKLAYQQQRPVIDVAMEQTDIEEVELRRILDPNQLT